MQTKGTMEFDEVCRNESGEAKTLSDLVFEGKDGGKR